MVKVPPTEAGGIIKKDLKMKGSKGKYQNIYNLSDRLYRDHKESLEAHIAYVQEAGAKLGLPYALLSVHDESKWDFEEFVPYAYKFAKKEHHTDTLQDPDHAFSYAWHRHMRLNPHHWQYWMFPDGYGAAGVIDGCLAMPEIYAKEMVADWLGASRAYTGSYDMSGWLDVNYHSGRIRLHPMTKNYVDNLLRELPDLGLF